MNYFEKYRKNFSALAANCVDFLHFSDEIGDALVYVAPVNLWAFILCSDMSDLGAVKSALKKAGYQSLYSITEFDGMQDCEPNEMCISTMQISFPYHVEL